MIRLFRIIQKLEYSHFPSIRFEHYSHNPDNNFIINSIGSSPEAPSKYRIREIRAEITVRLNILSVTSETKLYFITLVHMLLQLSQKFIFRTKYRSGQLMSEGNIFKLMNRLQKQLKPFA